jgi:dTDP-4-amino-4,6-dideoxygalactose transaminase
MHVPLLDLKAQYESIRSAIDNAVSQVIESQHFIQGPQVKECEMAIAEYCNSSHAVGVSSGTDALLISLMAEGIGAGDEVITTPFTFFATAGSIARLGAKPVFVDIDPRTFNMNSRLICDRITPRTRAVMPVHLFGQMADMAPIAQTARAHNLVLIEDAAQAIGAEYESKRAGSIGHYGCLSFFPSKNLGCFGDGGMVVTNDAERAAKLSLLRGHGAKPKYYHKLVGGNFRLDTLQAAVVLTKLQYLDQWTRARQANAKGYGTLFASTGLIREGFVELPGIDKGRHIFNQYVIRAKQRDQLRQYLKEHSVETEIYYPVPLHLQECFLSLGYRAGDFPESERAAQATLALPIYPELSSSQREYVVETIDNFYKHS